MNHGFVIDNGKCIGCHACSTACKSENEVPLGVSRTWVKYTEVGQFPDVSRHFQVTRCNHCANPPCVRICPVTAMYQRDDGIVEFDKNVCIGCKACLQACPYDAIHIDPESGTAAKCHYCSHRVEVGMEPACVVVCPEHAIIAGDMDDPNSEISKVLANNSVTVRKPEQGTSPKLFYIEGHEASLTPTTTQQQEQNYLWAQSISEQHQKGSHHKSKKAAHQVAHSGTSIRTPSDQGHPTGGPVNFRSTQAGQMVQVAYNAQHKVPWHWPVPAYLVTKGIGCGAFLILYIASLFGAAIAPKTSFIIHSLALAFIGITTVFLVIDLEKPERFLRIVFRPQWKSWLARGAFVLIGFSLVLTAGWLSSGTEWVFQSALIPQNILTALGLPLAVGAAVYTAFLFAQAEGRDLWQSPLLPVHLIAQAFLAGSAAILACHNVFPLSEALVNWSKSVLLWSVLADLALLLAAEFAIPHPSEVAAQAAEMMTKGIYKHHFWTGAILIGHVIPLFLINMSSEAALGIAGLAALAGLYAYEYAFVMAPQKIANS
jgi:Fe-S-cluster-containing dehydrogenase component/formate-dependent nitrite reductase membrane component NrfD